MSKTFIPQDLCCGEERLLGEAAAFVGRSAPAIATDLLLKVRAFAGSAPQSEDAVMLALRLGAGSSGPEGRA